MVDDVLQRQQQHATHRNPAGDNHRNDENHDGRKDPQDALIVAFVILNAFISERGLRLTPLAVDLLHRRLLLLGVLFKHIFQIALAQQNVHLRQRGGIYAVLLLQPIGQFLIQTRGFRQRVVFIVMRLGIGQQVFRGVHQFVQLTAINLRRHTALQTQHAAVQRHARLVQADPGVGKFRHVLAGKLRNGEVLFIVIQRIDENAGRDQLHDAEHKQHRNQKGNDFYTFKHALPFLYAGIV